MTPSLRLAVSAVSLLIMAGCASPTHKAPVEDRSRPNSGRSAAADAPPRVLPGAENAGKPGYYTVKPGDTLIRISLESGQNWHDIANWNGLSDPNRIEVGQVLRVVPPASDTGDGSALVAAKPVTTPRVESRSLDAKSGGGAAVTSKADKATSAVAAASTASLPDASAKDSAREAEEPNWQWPASGPVIGGFEEGSSKGLDIGGKAGDPVVAAADGRVVYAGSGLRGYGNLVIVKHNGDYLTAYAHNQTLLVKEDQVVRRGQKIAEMGATDADRVKLHFEIRKQGKPIDPAKQLPSR